jgi:hypothetical protein
VIAIEGTQMTVQTSVMPEFLGTIRRFGPHGVLYEIMKIIDDKRALVRVLDTSEATAYSLRKIAMDPVG